MSGLVLSVVLVLAAIVFLAKMLRMVPHYWVFVGAAAIAWGLVRLNGRRRPSRLPGLMAPPMRRAA